MVVPWPHSVLSQREKFVSQRVLLARDQPGITRSTEIFRWVETKTTDKPHRASHASSTRKRVLGANRLSGIFDQWNAEFLGDSVNAVHIAAEPEKMHGNNCTNRSSSLSQH